MAISTAFFEDNRRRAEAGATRLRTDPELARTFIRAANRERDFPRLFGNEF